MQALIYVETVVGWALLVAVATLLVRSYLRTRDVGFIWLAVASLVWPFMARPTHAALVYVGRTLPFRSAGQFAAAVNTSQQIVSLALLLIAVLYLGRTRTRCA